MAKENIMAKKQYDFVAIGDTVTDAFIELQDAAVEEGLLCMRFGDKIPYKNVTVVPGVGNSANAANAAAKLGLTSALITNLGMDGYANEAIAALEANGVHTDYVVKHEGKKTNYHYLLLFNAERTILIKHEDYPYVMPDIGSPGWVYLSSLGEHSLPFHGAIIDYLDEHPDIKLAFQPGTYQMKFGKEKLERVYKRSDLFFCNKQESQRILDTNEEDMRQLLSMMRSIGPKIPVITDGPRGAYVFDGNAYWTMPMYPDPKPPLDRTGAGDAFSSTFATALALGMSIEDALRWGPVNSMSVVQYIGAREGLLTRAQLEEYLSKAPEHYKPSQL
jgi:ribokinase